MAVAFVQDGGATRAYSSGSAAAVLSANTTVGNCVVLNLVSLANTAGDIASVVSTIGTFTKLNAVLPASASAGEMEQWICLAATGAANNITVTTTSGDGFIAQANEYSGVVSYVASVASGSSGTASSGALTIPTGGAALCGAITSGADDWGVHPSTPWVDYNTGQFVLTYDAAYCVTAGSQTASWTIGGSTGWGVLSVILLPVTTLPAPSIHLQAVKRASSWFKRQSGLWAPERGFTLPRAA